MRADVYITLGGYAKSRSRAKQMIETGGVFVDGVPVSKVSDEIDEAVPHTVKIDFEEKFVSRGGLKLEAALDAFGIDVAGFAALDIGASTGGFTDCLLKRGAAHVTAVDSGVGQLDERLRSDARVTNIEKYNAREISRAIIPEGADIAVMDVSFISQTLIIPALCGTLKDNGRLVSLIKPQFEAGRSKIGKGGIVKDPHDRLSAVLRVRDGAAACGLVMTGLIVSPIKGGDGNVEYLARFDKVGIPLSDGEIRKTVLR